MVRKHGKEPYHIIVLHGGPGAVGSAFGLARLILKEFGTLEPMQSKYTIMELEEELMVMENICFLLNQFIRCSAYENIIFCWVMHEQGIIDEIISKLETEDCQIYTISLICDVDVLKKRLQKDIDAGIRSEDVIQRSIARIGLYEKLDTEKIDVSHITSEQAAERIINGERRKTDAEDRPAQWENL